MPLPDTIILQYLSQKPQWATSPRILITPLMLWFLWLCLKRSWFLKRRKPLRKIGIIVISQSLKSLLAIRFLWVTYRRYCWYFCIHLSSCLLLFTVGVYSHNYLLLMSFVYTRMCGILENTAPRNTHKSVRASMTWIRIGRKKKQDIWRLFRARGKLRWENLCLTFITEMTCREVPQERSVAILEPGALGIVVNTFAPSSPWRVL